MYIEVYVFGAVIVQFILLVDEMTIYVFVYKAGLSFSVSHQR